MTTYLTDDFNRANSTTSLGSPVTGGPYTVQVGTWGINGNQAYTSASTADSVVTFPTAVDVDLQVTLAALGAALVARWVDNSNYWMVGSNGSFYAIFRRLAASNVQVAVSPVVPVAGDVMRMITKGRYVHLIVNGKIVLSVEDYLYAAATSTAGLRINSSTTARLDDLSAVDTTLIPGGVDGGTAMPAMDDFGPNTNSPQPAFVYRGRDAKTADEGNP